MLTKPADIHYCGVDIDKIRSANPVLNEEVMKYHHLYLTERHEIYKRKEIEKLPQKDWTKDEVFRDYRFTNIRRELDRESKWLIEKISTNNSLTLEQKILNTILFRTYNKSSTLSIIDYPITDFANLDIDAYRKVFEIYAHEHPKYVFFTPAFNTGGLKFANAFPKRIKDKAYLNQPGLQVTVICKENGERQEGMVYKDARDMVANEPDLYEIEGWEGNIPTRMIHMIKHLYEIDLQGKILEAETQQEAYEALLTVHGFSGFLAYQVFVDLTYIPEYKFSENEFTISGPGCNRGLNDLFEDRDGLSDEELLFWVRDNIQKKWKEAGWSADYSQIFDHLPDCDQGLNVMMLENSFCELSKLTKAKRGTGRPRNRYNPTEVIPEVNSLLEDW